MNLYIINEVLYDYTPGMCVIAAESLSHCEDIFVSEFGKYKEEKTQEEFNAAQIKVIENVNHPAGVVAYEYGGG